MVAVIDTGVDYTHPDLAANIYSNPAECNANGIDDDSNGFVDDCYGIDTVNGDSDPADDNRHGTHVAGTIGAIGNNGIGVAGVAWNVKILPCKFMGTDGTGPTSAAITCLDYVAALAVRGVNIVATNNSWGGGGFSQALADAIANQRPHGILFIAAAGNNGLNHDYFPTYPCLTAQLMCNIRSSTGSPTCRIGSARTGCRRSRMMEFEHVSAPSALTWRSVIVLFSSAEVALPPARIRLRTARQSRVGSCAFNSAAMPVTWGVAMEVPSSSP